MWKRLCQLILKLNLLGQKKVSATMAAEIFL
jgi:hypothetical protein